MLARIWMKGNAGALLGVGSKLMRPLQKTEWRFLKILETELLQDPSVPLLGIYLKKIETLIWKDTCTSVFFAALFTIAKMWKQSKCPLSSEWIKKIWCVCLCCGLLAIKKNEILSLVTTEMDLDSILLSEISQTNKDKYQMISLACGS